jgi:hypothetical protein
VNGGGGRFATGDIAVLPYAPGRRSERWRLELHGGVTHPDCKGC